MFDKQAVLRIREGAFVYLLATDKVVSIERRSASTFQMLNEAQGLQVAWYSSGTGQTGSRVPVYRLGLLFRDRVREWGHAIILDDGGERMCVAAEQVHLIPEHDKPAVQPFNPVGSRIPGGLIVGLCPGTEPEHLVLDAVRLYESLRRREGA